MVGPELVGVCTFSKALECSVPGKPDHVTSVCKQMLDYAIKRLEADPTLSLSVIGNHNQGETDVVAAARANNTLKYFTDGGIEASRVRVSTGNSGTRTVELWLIH